MAKLKILVTAVGGDLGQSVIKCLRDSSDTPYILGFDMNPYAAGRPDVDEFMPAPPVKDTHRYTEFLLKLIEEKNIDYVFPLSEVEIDFFNEHREIFKGRAAVVMNEKRLIDTFTDKYRTVEFFKEKGILYPRTWKAEAYSRAGQWEFPLILKRRRGSGSQGLLKVHDDEEMQFYLKRYKERHKEMIIQEYLPGEDNEYTAGIFSDGEHIQTITFKRTLAPGGFSQHVETISDETITQFPEQIGRALDFKGSINVQFRQTQRGSIPFEINPRLSSTVFFRHRFGFKDVWWWLDLLAGKRISYPLDYGKGIGVKKFSEVFFPEDF